MEKYRRRKLELKYRAHVFDVYNDYLTMPDGREVVYDFIDHRAGACVLPVTENGDIVLVSQYRNSVDDITLEAPAGLIEDGETPEQAARRELREETGCSVDRLEFVAETVPAIGTSNEKTYVYIGRGIAKGQMRPDENEFVEREVIPISEALDMISDGRIVDSKTIIAIYAYANSSHKNM